MSAEPLLGAGGGAGAASGSACRFSVPRWWTTTTSQKYIISRASRRHLWWVYGVIVAAEVFCDLVYSVLYPADVLERVADSAVDAAVVYMSEFCLCLMFVCLPTDTLKSDACICVCLALQFLTYVALPLQIMSWDSVAWTLLLKVFVCHALGIHSCAVICFASCSLLVFFTSWHADTPSGLEAFAFAVPVISSMMTLVEWLLASSFLELEEHIDALQNLLDNAAEGYFTVTRSTGTITRVSAGLQDIFGTGILGAQLLDFVDCGDHVKVRALFDYGKLNAAQPVLVTFLQRRQEGGFAAAEFDARLVPYRVTGADVYISLQMVGEVRMASGLSDGAHGASESEELGWAAARTGEHQGSGLQVGSVSGPSGPPLAHQGAARSPLHAGDSPAMQESEAPTHAPDGPPEAGYDLKIVFDSGHPDFLIGDRDCGSELLPCQGRLVHWLPRRARPRFEKWIVDGVNNCVNRCGEDGLWPLPFEDLELVIPATPATRVRAARAWILAGHPDHDDGGGGGGMSVPATLCLTGATISRRRACGGLLSAISEGRPEDDEDALTQGSSEDISPSDSASAVARPHIAG